MNYTILTRLCIAAVLLCIGCNREFLDKAPGIDVDENTIFSSQTEVETYVAGMYLEGVHSMLGLHSQVAGVTSARFGTKGACDEAELGATWADEQGWNSGSISTTSVTYVDYRYHIRWSAIRRANNLLDKIGTVPNVVPDYIEQVTGEAHFIRAMNYFEMLKRYGGIPIVDKVLTAADILESPLTRNTFAEVMDFIVSDCDAAIAGLPNQYPPQMRGRATKGAALMVKAKALLLAASPQFNTAAPYLDFGPNNALIAYGNHDPERWRLAADAAKAVMDWAPQAGIELITDQGTDKNYKYMWEVHDNPEIIFENKHAPLRRTWHYPFLGILPTSIYGGYGGTSPTLNFVKFYEKKDGTPQTWDEHGGNDLQQKYAELDPRFAQSILYNGVRLNAEYPNIETFQGGAHEADCKGGTWQRKFVPDILGNNTGAIPHNYIYRLADAYLMFAEAINEYSGPSDAAYSAVNAIRARSGMPDLPPNLDQETFRSRVRNERAVELVFEDNRLWDIMRWQIAEEEGVMKGAMWGIRIYPIAGSDEFRYEPYVFEERSFPTRMYLHPFLQGEVDKGYLVQNPGW